MKLALALEQTLDAWELVSRWSWRRSSRQSRVGLDLARLPQSPQGHEAVEHEALKQKALDQETLEQMLELVLARRALDA